MLNAPLPFFRLVVPATVGALPGSVGGVVYGEGLGWSGDDRGLTGMLVFGAAGGALGSATDAWLAKRLTCQEALTASAVGLVPGVMGGVGGRDRDRRRMGLRGRLQSASASARGLTQAVARAMAR